MNWRPRGYHPAKKLSGVKASEYRPWRFQIDAKIRTDSPLYPDDESKVTYALTQMEDPIFSALQEWVISQDSCQFDDFNREIQFYMGCQFQTYEAERALLTITQKMKESITEYYHRISALWNLAQTPEKERIHKFLTSIRPVISRTFLSREFTSVAEVLETARVVEERRKDIDTRFPRAFIKNKPSDQLATPRENHKSHPNSSFGPVAKKPNNWFGNWYDPEENPKRLTDELREELIKQGRCWSCRGSGHRGADTVCPRSRGLGDVAAKNVPAQFGSKFESKMERAIPEKRLLISRIAVDKEEKLKRGEHMVLKGIANGIPVRSLLDNGSEADLIDEEYVCKYKIPTLKLNSPISLHLADGTKLQNLTKAALIDFHVGEHHEQWLFYVAKLGEYQMIVGDNWLQEHNPQINWTQRSLTFNSANCFEKGCLSQGKVYTEYTHRTRKPTAQDKEDLDIQMVKAKEFFRLATRRDHHGFLLLPRNNEKYFCAATTNAVTSDDYDRFMKGKPEYTKEELLAKIPEEYHDFVDVFMKQDADRLPPHRPEDHMIQLIEGAIPPFARNYKPMSIQEQEAVRKYIQGIWEKALFARAHHLQRPPYF